MIKGNEGDESAVQSAETADEVRASCTNPHCTDGYVDKEFGTQDGSHSWVEQVRCQVCNPYDEEEATLARHPDWR